jgi:DNA-binding PadR family transcriptional regulator
MVTDIVILALLANHSKHGYQIKKDIGQILERETKLNNNLLYPALRRLEESGAIEREKQDRQCLPNKHVYHITLSGEELFKQLVTQYKESDIAKEEEFLTRLAFLDMLNKGERLRLLDIRLSECKRRLEHHKSVDGTFSHEFASPWINLVMKFRERRLTDEIEWITDLKQSITNER